MALVAATSSKFAAAADHMDCKWWGDYAIETTRGPRFFNPPPPRKAGFTYNDDFRMDLTGTLDSGMGMTMTGSFDVDVDVESKLSQGAAGPGSLKVEITMENLVANLIALMFQLHCDSNDPDNSDHPDCDDVLAMMGSTETIETDTNGDVTSITTFDGQTFTAEELGLNVDPEDTSPAAPAVMGDDSLNSKFQAQQFAASMHFDKHQEIIKLLPDHAVNPGDSWIDNVDMNGMGVFKGTSYLKGYTNYKGSDCALFYFEGSLHLDMTAIAQLLGPEDAADLPKTMTDAKITSAIFWDVADELPRWAQANITTTLEMDNPMAADQEDTMTVPLEFSLRMESDIVDRPAVSENGSVETTSSSSSLSAVPMNESSSKGDGRGRGGTFFVVLLLVGSVGGGYYVYQKRQQQERIMQLDRPGNGNTAQYEFSSLGSEPIA
jgi:hypothetical protein